MAEIGITAGADRLGVVVDAADYYRAFASAVEQARRSVLIMGWEVDSGVRLWRDEEANVGDRPAELGDFLSSVLGDREQLEIHVLCWDWALFYALERENLPRIRMGAQTHDRLHFELDGSHPVGASRHEKLVVVDDEVAFIGGIDLGRRRWDTSHHRPEEPRRRSPEDTAYRPFHDIQAVVSGPVVRCLADHFRARWEKVTGDELEPVTAAAADPWPETVTADLEDTTVGVIRTNPETERDETRRWHRQALAGAERRIYLENQFFTWHELAELLPERLRDPDPPEVMVVTSRTCEGWLERSTMDALRDRNLRQLAAADPGDRTAAWWPDIGDGRSPTVHTKLSVVDDRLGYLGSANLSNRSMGLDSEIGLGFDADRDDRHEGFLRGLRQRLTAEHLGVEPATVAAAESDTGSMLAAVRDLCGGDRTLRPLEPDRASLGELLTSLAPLFDPERPAHLDDLKSMLPTSSDPDDPS